MSMDILKIRNSGQSKANETIMYEQLCLRVLNRTLDKMFAPRHAGFTSGLVSEPFELLRQWKNFLPAIPNHPYLRLRYGPAQ